jgi:hypothetical protein
VIAHLVGAVLGILNGAAAAASVVAGLAGGPPPLLEAACDGRLALQAGSRVRSSELDEISGVVESRSRPGVLWVHNDSGDSARLFAIGLRGRLLGTYALSGVEAVDWEDIAAGPGPLPGKRYLYVGDIGDNERTRDTISVLRLVEPVVDTRHAPQSHTVTGVDELVLRYPDGPHDAEALLVDPRARSLVIVTKALDGRVGVYRAPGGIGIDAGSVTVLRRVATLRLGFGALVTGGDVSRSGRVVALRTYGSVLLYDRPAGKPLWAAFRSRRCTGVTPPERQGEAIALRVRGRSYLTVGEGEHPRIFRVLIRA